jgi:urea ABC transporter ATP-binding protein UrtE
MLSVDNLVASYNAGPVLQGVSLSVQAGEVVALLGRNGVGKSTLLRTLVGLVPSWDGSIRIDGTPLAPIATHDIARMGMALVPQGRGIIGKLSVADNLRAAMRAAGSRPALSIDQAIAPFPALREKLPAMAGTLSGGQQQQLAIARAMVSRPKVLLLDEPSEGVQPNIVQQIGQLVRKLADESGLAVLIVEQNLELALATANRCIVMAKGRIVHSGSPDEFRNEAVLRRHLAL